MTLRLALTTVFSAAITRAQVDFKDDVALSLIQTVAKASHSLEQSSLEHIPEDDVKKPIVCISLPAYEEPEWIDALMANLEGFTEASTRVVIHLNIESEYKQEQLKAWNSSSKFSINPSRNWVDSFHGGILWAHLENARHMEKRWPGHCTYFVMQASNQMWVRTGLEKEVIRQQIAPWLELSECSFNPYVCDHAFIMQLTGKDQSKVGWGPPEGHFQPMRTTMEFVKFMDKWIHEKKVNVTEEIIYKPGQFEEYWLQTYNRNLAAKIPDPPRGSDFVPLCKRVLGKGVTPDMVKDLVDGTLPEYSVKRVQRDLNDPATKMLVKLSHWKALKVQRARVTLT